jgi:hypothetical protein
MLRNIRPMAAGLRVARGLRAPLAILVAAGFCLGSVPASADQERKKLTPEETIVEFDMPGLKGARQTHERWWTDQYDTVVHLSEQWTSKARAIVRISDVQRGYKFRPPADIDEKWVQARSSFFRKTENAVKMGSSRQSSDGQVREARFTAGTANCYALSAFYDGSTLGATLQKVGRRNVSVVYCGEPDKPLDDATVEAVKKGYRLKG